MDIDLKVLIARHPGGNSKCSEISISEIDDVHWSNTSGGAKKRHSGYALYGKIPYSLGKNRVDCSGLHDYGKNPMKVYICPAKKGDKFYLGYMALLNEAGPKPTGSITRPSGEPPCTKKILYLLSEKPYFRKELRDSLLHTRYLSKTIRGALWRLKKQGRIVCDGAPQSPKQIISLPKDNI